MDANTSLSTLILSTVNAVFDKAVTPVLMFHGSEHIAMALRIFTFAKLCDALQEISWQEHTSDWDPFLVIHMKDGSTLETSSGYYSLTLEGMTDKITLCCGADTITHVLFDACDDDSDHETTLRVAIDDIERLELVT